MNIKLQKAEKVNRAMSQNLFGTQIQISTLKLNLDKWEIKQTDVLAKQRQEQSSSVLSSEVKKDGEILAAIKRLKERIFIYGFFYGCKARFLASLSNGIFGFISYPAFLPLCFHLINFIIGKNQSANESGT